MKSALIFLSLFLSALSPVVATSSYGDEWFPTVEFTCLPEINYFHLQTTGLYNIEPNNIPKIEWAGTKESGIARLRDWLNHPISCQIGHHEYVVRVIDYQSPIGQQECGAVEDGGLELTLDGKVIITSHSVYGGCQEFVQADVKISRHKVVYCELLSLGGVWNPPIGKSESTVNCKSMRILP